MRLLAAFARRAAPRPETARADPALLPRSAAVPARVAPSTPMPRLAAPAAAAPAVIALPPPRDRRPRHDLRHVSPRRFAEIAHELYVEGSLKWPEYQLIGFPSELHPDYDATIGALTGQRAEPNRPRDLLAEWEQRVDFMRRYGDPSLDVAEGALAVLRRQAEPRP